MTKAAGTLTKTDVKEVVQGVMGPAVRDVIDEISGIINSFGKQIDERFNEVEIKVDANSFALRHGLTETNREIADGRASIDRLTGTIDGFVKRLDHVETEATARDAQYNRLLAWAQKVSTKTGIPLEY